MREEVGMHACRRQAVSVGIYRYNTCVTGSVVGGPNGETGSYVNGFLVWKIV